MSEMLGESENAAQANRYYAENYERLYHNYLCDPRVTLQLEALLKDRIDKDRALIVDLGCGIGRQMTELADAFGISAKRNLGVDISPGMKARHEATQSDLNNTWKFIPGDFADANIQVQIIDHIKAHEVSFVIFLCLGNSIGHLPPEHYQSLAGLMEETSSVLAQKGACFLFIEYREGREYRKMWRPDAPSGTPGVQVNTYGSAEFLGQLGSEFFAFYIREDVDEARYNLFLYSLSVDGSEGKQLKCSLSGLVIKNAFYVDGAKLSSAFRKPTITQLEITADSALEKGRIIGFQCGALPEMA